MTLDLVKRCARCTVPGVDPATGIASTVVPDVLATYRHTDDGVMFGINAIVIDGAGSELRAGTSVDVTLKNYSITVAGGSKLAPGTYTFNVTNKGPSSHNLTVNGPGVSDQATPTFAPWTQKLTVKLQKGSYELFCSVPGHKQLGMDTHITVG